MGETNCLRESRGPAGTLTTLRQRQRERPYPAEREVRRGTTRGRGRTSSHSSAGLRCGQQIYAGPGAYVLATLASGCHIPRVYRKANYALKLWSPISKQSERSPTRYTRSTRPQGQIRGPTAISSGSETPRQPERAPSARSCSSGGLTRKGST